MEEGKEYKKNSERDVKELLREIQEKIVKITKKEVKIEMRRKEER